MPKPNPRPLVRVHADWEDVPPPQLAVTINDAARISALGRTSIYEPISDGRLDAVKAGQRTLVLMESLRGFLASLPRLRRAAMPEKRA
jgi:hypothetical protein